jgi:hypothetical protein
MKRRDFFKVAAAAVVVPFIPSARAADWFHNPFDETVRWFATPYVFIEDTPSERNVGMAALRVWTDNGLTYFEVVNDTTDTLHIKLAMIEGGHTAAVADKTLVIPPRKRIMGGGASKALRMRVQDHYWEDGMDDIRKPPWQRT